MKKELEQKDDEVSDIEFSDTSSDEFEDDGDTEADEAHKMREDRSAAAFWESNTMTDWTMEWDGIDTENKNKPNVYYEQGGETSSVTFSDRHHNEVHPYMPN